MFRIPIKANKNKHLDINSLNPQVNRNITLTSAIRGTMPTASGPGYWELRPSADSTVPGPGVTIRHPLCERLQGPGCVVLSTGYSYHHLLYPRALYSASVSSVSGFNDRRGMTPVPGLTAGGHAVCRRGGFCKNSSLVIIMQSTGYGGSPYLTPYYPVLDAAHYRSLASRADA